MLVKWSLYIKKVLEMVIYIFYICKPLIEFLSPYRVVNLSSSAGKLSRIPGEELRKKLSSSTLTDEELCSLMSQFVKWV